MAHQEIMTLIIGYTCVGVFVATSFITVLSLVNVIKIEHKAKNKLFAVLVVEILTIGVGTFAGFLNPKPLSDKVESLEIVNNGYSSVIENPGSKFKPRVFFHITDESQRGLANGLAKKISSDGSLVVPGIQKVDKSKSPPSNELRFFRKSEEEEANKIALKISESGVKVTLRYVAGYENSDKVRAGTYELWISSSN
ncbi:MAG: hypothetical protein BWK80_04735 [Desulfobacteraceae bacterium IS3]|nr:MAG: hypothetical protein BWK80_04735 [Desulfobacteraceae bacterium IS3]